MKTDIAQSNAASDTESEKADRRLLLIILSVLGGGTFIAGIMAMYKGDATFQTFLDSWWIIAFMGLSYLPGRLYTVSFVFMIGLVVFEAWGIALDAGAVRGFATKHLVECACLAISAIFTLLFWLTPKRP